MQSISTAFALVDIPTDWDPRTNQQPTGLLIALPSAVPCCSRPTRAPRQIKNPPMQSISTAFVLVDIPTDWDPQANQQPTGLLVALPLTRQSRLVRAPPGTPPNKKIRRCKASADFLVGCPVGLEPTVSRSTIWRVNRLRYGHHIDAPEGTRTPGPLLRRQLLYPPELRAHVVIPMGSIMAAVLCRHRLREK